jgi:predicted permease
MTSAPARALVWLLRLVSSRDEANAAVGDVFEELHERNKSDRGPSRPRLWLNLQIIRAIGTAVVTRMPRLVRSGGLIIRDATRALRAAPAQALFIVLVLAIGISAGTITFSVVDAVILRPLPVEEPNQLVTIAGPDFKRRISPEMYWRIREHLQSVDTLAARSTTTGVTFTVSSVTQGGAVTAASSDIFRLLRWSPAIGRFWTTEDEARGDVDVAVLGHRFWRERFQGSTSVLGEKVTVDERPRAYRVIGVLPGNADHPELDLTSTPVWIPLVVPRTGSGHWGGILARLRPGVSIAQVSGDVERIVSLPEWRPVVSPLHEVYVSRLRGWMMLALGAAGLVVLIACVNAANLMLTRSSGRAQELAVRASLGASRRRLAAAMLAEGLLLSAGATGVALLVGIAGVRAVKNAITTALLGTFRAETISLNGRVLAAAVAAAVLTGVLVSLVPAWQSSRTPLSSLLKDATAASTARRRWRSVFLVTEVATVVVLLVVSWLFVASLIRVAGIELGIDRANLLAVKPRAEFRGSVDDVKRTLEVLPDVKSVAVATGASLPLIGSAFGGAWITNTMTRADGSAGSDDARKLTVLQYRVTANYFDVAGMSFLRGRTWPDDPALNATAVVLDEQGARQLFGADDPVGRQVRATDPAGVFTVVGTVPHVFARGPEATDPPAAYIALSPNPARNYAGLFVKTSRPADEMVALVNDALTSLAPLTPPDEPFVFVADEAVRRITATRRFNAGLMSAFGLVGVLIGAAGVYAVMGSFVAQQTREIGVRLALGATPLRIQRGVLALAWRHLLIGLALGVPVAWWLSRGFASLLFQVTPGDVSVYIGVSTTLIAIGVLAAWIPAHRAGKVDPLVSLRQSSP